MSMERTKRFFIFVISILLVSGLAYAALTENPDRAKIAWYSIAFIAIALVVADGLRALSVSLFESLVALRQQKKKKKKTEEYRKKAELEAEEKMMSTMKSDIESLQRSHAQIRKSLDETLEILEDMSLEDENER